MSLHERHVILDLETTGLSPRQGRRVIEIGAVAVETGFAVTEFSSLIDTGVPFRTAYKQSTASPTKCF